MDIAPNHIFFTEFSLIIDLEYTCTLYGISAVVAQRTKGFLDVNNIAYFLSNQNAAAEGIRCLNLLTIKGRQGWW